MIFLQSFLMSEGLFLFLETFIIIIYIKFFKTGGLAKILQLHFDVVVGEVLDNSEEVNDEVHDDVGEVI